MEGVRPMLELIIIISSKLIKNPYLIQNYITSEERNIKRNKYNDENIIINLPTGGGVSSN